MDDSGDITQNRQTNVDEQIGTASSLKEHSQRGKENSEDELANITINEESQPSSTLTSAIMFVNPLLRSSLKSSQEHAGPNAVPEQSGCQARRSGGSTYDAVKAILRVEQAVA